MLNYKVVDDFCPEIEWVRASVYEAGFDTWNPNQGEVGSSVYEGMGFVGDHAFLLRALVGEMQSMVIPNSMFFRVTNKDTERAYIHSDREFANHTCIVYMSEHEEPIGTAFYRHKPTGLIEMPSFADMQEEGIFDQLKEDMVSRDPDKWEQIDFVEGKYNRALIFDAPLFHSRFPEHGVGDTEEEGRLIWGCHFYKLNGLGQLT